MPFPTRFVPFILGAFVVGNTLTARVPGAFAAPAKKAASTPDAAAQKVARRSIAALYEKSAAAIKRKDIAALSAMESPDYQSYSPGGHSQSSAQELAGMRQFLSSVDRVLKFESRILSLTWPWPWPWRGPDAVVRAQNTGVFLLRRGGQTLRVETVDVSRDYWSQTSKGWQIRQVVHGQPKTWVNGKRTG